MCRRGLLQRGCIKNRTPCGGAEVSCTTTTTTATTSGLPPAGPFCHHCHSAVPCILIRRTPLWYSFCHTMQYHMILLRMLDCITSYCSQASPYCGHNLLHLFMKRNIKLCPPLQFIPKHCNTTLFPAAHRAPPQASLDAAPAYSNSSLLYITPDKIPELSLPPRPFQHDNTQRHAASQHCPSPSVLPQHYIKERRVV